MGGRGETGAAVLQPGVRAAVEQAVHSERPGDLQRRLRDGGPRRLL